MAEQVKLALEAIGLQEQGAAVGLWVMALFGKGAPLALSAVVHKYGDVFSGRIEFRSPSFDALRTGFDPSRRRDTPAPPQDELDSVLKADR